MITSLSYLRMGRKCIWYPRATELRCNESGWTGVCYSKYRAELWCLIPVTGCFSPMPVSTLLQRASWDLGMDYSLAECCGSHGSEEGRPQPSHTGLSIRLVATHLASTHTDVTKQDRNYTLPAGVSSVASPMKNVVKMSLT